MASREHYDIINGHNSSIRNKVNILRGIAGTGRLGRQGGKGRGAAIAAQLLLKKGKQRTKGDHTSLSLANTQSICGLQTPEPFQRQRT